MISNKFSKVIFKRVTRTCITYITYLSGLPTLRASIETREVTLSNLQLWLIVIPFQVSVNLKVLRKDNMYLCFTQTFTQALLLPYTCFETQSDSLGRNRSIYMIQNHPFCWKKYSYVLIVKLHLWPSKLQTLSY